MVIEKNRITNIEVKKKNRNRIFRYICRNGIVSNPDIAYDLKISLPTVTQNTKELLEQGLIKEAGELQSTGGRRAKALTAASDSRLAAGLDITKNHIGLLLADLTGEIVKYERLHQPYIGDENYYRHISGRLEAFLKDSPAGAETMILGTGISFPGIVDLEKRELSYSHALGVKGLSFSDVERCFHYPCVFLNDANAGAYAEGFEEEGPEHFFYLSLSNTVGGAVYSRGHLVQGEEYRCGEVGHMTVVPDGLPCYCGKAGCLDAYCCAGRLADLAGGKLEAFFTALDQGNREFEDAWEFYTDYLALAVNNLHMVLDCDIILGGYVGGCMKEHHLEKIRSKVSGRNTFSEDGSFVKACRHKAGTALGDAMLVIEGFLAQV